MKKWSTLFISAAMVMSLGVCGLSAAAKGDRLEQIKEKGVLEVTTEPYFAPYEFIDTTKSGDDQYAGADMELAKYIADKIGVELKIVPLEFSAVQAGVVDGKYDLAISALAYSPAREEAMRLSKGYQTTESQGYGFIIREEDKDKYNSVEDLEDAVVATQSGSVQESIYMENVPKVKDYKLFSAMTDAYLAVAEGKADVCICSIDSASLYAEANGGLYIPEFRFVTDPELDTVRVGATVDGTESLIDLVNECIDELVENDDQYGKWYAEASEQAAALGID